MRERGFTLLEVLVATTIMGIAVVGLLSGITGSLRNASRLTDRDRAVLVARAMMDQLLVDKRLPVSVTVQGTLDPVLMGGERGGWRAQITPFEAAPNPGPVKEILERLELEIWWMSGDERRTFSLEAFRRAPL